MSVSDWTLQERKALNLGCGTSSLGLELARRDSVAFALRACVRLVSMTYLQGASLCGSRASRGECGFQSYCHRGLDVAMFWIGFCFLMLSAMLKAMRQIQNSDIGAMRNQPAPKMRIQRRHIATQLDMLNSRSADVWETAESAKVACGRHSRHAISEQQLRPSDRQGRKGSSWISAKLNVCAVCACSCVIAFLISPATLGGHFRCVWSLSNSFAGSRKGFGAPSFLCFKDAVLRFARIRVNK